LRTSGSGSLDAIPPPPPPFLILGVMDPCIFSRLVIKLVQAVVSPS
jgi:hypothetical protein